MDISASEQFDWYEGDWSQADAEPIDESAELDYLDELLEIADKVTNELDSIQDVR